MTALLLLLACARAPLSQESLAGAYEGAPCGERTYERVLTLRPDGTYTGEDRVSPCPPDAQCVWSGIVTFEGTWRLEGDDAIELVEREVSSPSDAAQVRPSRLAITDRALVGPKGCEYRRPLPPR